MLTIGLVGADPTAPEGWGASPSAPEWEPSVGPDESLTVPEWEPSVGTANIDKEDVSGSVLTDMREVMMLLNDQHDGSPQVPQFCEPEPMDLAGKNINKEEEGEDQGEERSISYRQGLRVGAIAIEEISSELEVPELVIKVKKVKKHKRRKSLFFWNKR